MKFLHTGDWHIGKKLHGYDLLEEQQAAFEQMLRIAQEQEVDAIVIAGDLYDRSVPATEAVEIFQQMVIDMNLLHKFPVFAISGNHDSPIRLETGQPWMEATDFYLHTRIDQSIQPIEFNGIQFFLLPYFEPVQARLFFQDEEIKTVEEAMKRIIEEMKQYFKPGSRQILVAHFFVAGSEKSESETKLTVGGLDLVPLSLLKDFDYVALGHLHSKNALQTGNARYSGSLLKYSLAERDQTKGVWIVSVDQNGSSQEFYPIDPIRDVIQLEESFETLMSPSFYHQVEREDYIGILLTNQEVIPNVMNQLRSIYPNIIHLERANGPIKLAGAQFSKQGVEDLAPEQLFRKYFTATTGSILSQNQENWLQAGLTSTTTEQK